MVIDMELRDYAVNIVLKYLDFMDKDYVYDDKMIKIKEKLDGTTLDVYVKITNNWVIIFALGLDLGELDKDTKLKVLEKLLNLNANSLEVKYSLEDNKIMISVESNIYTLTFDNFYMEYGAVPFGYKQLLKEVIPIIMGQKKEQGEA